MKHLLNYENYGTHAFDLSIMKNMIKLDHIGRLNYQDWLMAVPDVYREKVFQGLCFILACFFGVVASEKIINQIIYALQNYIAERIEPKKYEAIYGNRTITK